MSIFTNATKTSAFSATNTPKSSSAWYRFAKAGFAWLYDQTSINYDGPLDEITHLPVYYNSEGTLPSWTNTPKS